MKWEWEYVNFPALGPRLLRTGREILPTGTFTVKELRAGGLTVEHFWFISFEGAMYWYDEVCELEPKYTIPSWWMAW